MSVRKYVMDVMESVLSTLLERRDEPFCGDCRRHGEVTSAAQFGDYSLCGRCHKSVTSSEIAYRAV